MKVVLADLKGAYGFVHKDNFDGFTPTFHHPRLSAREPTFLLTAAWSRFYLSRPVAC